MKADANIEEHRTKPAMAASAPVLERNGSGRLRFRLTGGRLRFWLPVGLADFNSMMVSAACHFSVLIVLGLITVAGTGGGHSDELVMTLGGGGPAPGEGNDLGLPEGSQFEEPSQLESTADLAAVIGPVNPENDAQVVSTPMTTDIVAPDALALSAAELSGGDGTAFEGKAGPEGSESQLFGILGGNGRGGGGKGDGSSSKATEFFGIGGYGQTFVYVVDASDSMNDNGKFERARYELLRSIDQLHSDQQYYVVFYNEGAYPMDADKPLIASPDNVAKTTTWIKQVQPTGGTNPLPALLYALSLRPDAIYFLSDGRFDPAVLQEMRFRNRQNLRLKIRQIPIHTVAFFDRMAEGLMRTIARNSGGEYRFVQ